MKRSLTKLCAAMAISSLPMATIATTTVVLSADLAMAAGKSGDKGNSGGKGNAGGGKGNDKGNGKADRGNGAHASAMRGLNSLKRNINGLMNSSDPKMAGFQSYLLANAALKEAQDLFAIAQEEYDLALADYEALELTGDAEADLLTLQTALEGLEAPDPETATQEDVDAYNAQLEALTTSIATVETFITESAEFDTAMEDVAAASEGASEEEMLQAFVDAMHASGQTDFTLDDITEEMLALFQKHIDAYSN